MDGIQNGRCWGRWPTLTTRRQCLPIQNTLALALRSPVRARAPCSALVYPPGPVAERVSSPPEVSNEVAPPTLIFPPTFLPPKVTVDDLSRDQKTRIYSGDSSPKVGI